VGRRERERLSESTPNHLHPSTRRLILCRCIATRYALSCSRYHSSTNELTACALALSMDSTDRRSSTNCRIMTISPLVSPHSSVSTSDPDVGVWLLRILSSSSVLVSRSSQAGTPDFPHILFYGPSGAGKKTRIMCTLRALFGPGVEKVRSFPYFPLPLCRFRSSPSPSSVTGSS
jgi:hypothetical protein